MGGRPASQAPPPRWRAGSRFMTRGSRGKLRICPEARTPHPQLARVGFLFLLFFNLAPSKLQLNEFLKTNTLCAKKMNGGRPRAPYGGTNYPADLWRAPLSPNGFVHGMSESRKRGTGPTHGWTRRGAARRAEWPAPGRRAAGRVHVPRREGVRPPSGLSALLSGLGTHRKGRAPPGTHSSVLCVLQTRLGEPRSRSRWASVPSSLTAGSVPAPVLSWRIPSSPTALNSAQWFHSNSRTPSPVHGGLEGRVCPRGLGEGGHEDGPPSGSASKCLQFRLRWWPAGRGGWGEGGPNASKQLFKKTEIKIFFLKPLA